MKEYLILAPIIALFALGLLIALHSGDVNLATPAGRRTVLDNLSATLLRVIGYGAGLVLVQRFVGFPIQLPW